MAVKSPEASRRRFTLSAKSAPYVFVAPAVILFLTFTLYPIIASLVLSFQTREGGVQSFAGLDNYARLLNDNLFYTALQNTFLILVVQVPIMLSLALVLAVALNSALVRMKGFFRVSFFMPVVTSLVAYAIIFLILLNQDFGLVNYVLSLVGIDPIPWLTSGFWAKVSIILALTWRWMGYNMVIYLAGLQGIPQELYEAAAVDGANKWKQFTNITIPQLRPIILFTVVLSTIGTLQLFDEPFILTGGGPNNATLTITMYLYQNGFQFFDFGYASAIAYVLVLIIAVLSYLQIRFGGERD
jgi:lactose/L-arabinose transport system permease protein